MTTEIEPSGSPEEGYRNGIRQAEDLLGEEAAQFTLVCIPAALRRIKRREEICKATGMTNAYPAFSYTHDVDEDGDPVDELHIDEAFLPGQKNRLFDDIIAVRQFGGQVCRPCKGLWYKVRLALALGKNKDMTRNKIL